MTPPHLPSLIRQRIRSGRYVVGGHAIAHAAAEGFTVANALAVVLSGLLIEDYPDRARCLFAGRVRVGPGRRIWLHVVCDYNDPEVAGIVTAYVPDLAQWEHPPFRRR